MIADLGDGALPFLSAYIEVQSQTVLRTGGFVDWWRDQPWLSSTPLISRPRMEDRIGYLRSPTSDVIDSPSWRHVDRESYRNNSYPRTAVALRSLVPGG